VTKTRNEANYQQWRWRYEVVKARGVDALDESACIRNHIDRVTTEARRRTIG